MGTYVPSSLTFVNHSVEWMIKLIISHCTPECLTAGGFFQVPSREHRRDSPGLHAETLAVSQQHNHHRISRVFADIALNTFSTFSSLTDSQHLLPRTHVRWTTPSDAAQSDRALIRPSRKLGAPGSTVGLAPPRRASQTRAVIVTVVPSTVPGIALLPTPSLLRLTPPPLPVRCLSSAPIRCSPVQLPVANASDIAAAAARINAQLQARKGIQHVDVPPVRSTAAPSNNGESATPAGAINGEMYISDGDYIKDIEVNDLRNRYLLTKGSTQKMVNYSLVIRLIHHQLPCRWHSWPILHDTLVRDGLAYLEA